MRYRKYDQAFVQEQFNYRKECFDSFHSFSLAGFKDTLAHKESILSILNLLVRISGRTDKSFFLALEHLMTGLFQSVEYFDQLLLGSPNAEAKRVAARLHAKLALDDLAKCDTGRPAIGVLKVFSIQLSTVGEIKEFELHVAEFKKSALPMIYSLDSQDIIISNQQEEDNPSDPGPETPLISVLFYFDKELWANPQVIKPEHLYTLSGLVKVKSWPQGYTTLHLLPVTTTDDSWYTLSLPSLPYSNKSEIPINGHITVHAPQSWLDPPIAIRLFAYFSGSGKENLHPEVIGYDQLVLKVIDTSSFPFPTGYDSLNKIAFDLVDKIMQEVPDVDRTELTNFLILLSALLNYQGYCYQHNVYKNKAEVTESEFRDALIGHLSARENLSEKIVKEGAIAGGRVEINFNGIVTELKVEKSRSDRVKLMDSHEQQAVAYAAATGTRLSILCILDLTPKKMAPAPASRNVFLRKPEVHGFPADDSPSRVVIIFIDGNLPNPSSYK